MSDSFPDILHYSTAHSLARKFNTPLYVYSKRMLTKQANELISFRSPFGLTVRYAMKANPHLEILRLFNSMGIWIDASSEYEAQDALAAGFTPERIVLNSQQLPKSFINQGFHFCATSLHQLTQYCKLFPNTECGVRLNPGTGSGMCNRVTTGGVTAGFGIWHEYIPQVLELVKEYGVTIVKVHTHIGGGVLAENWKEAAAITLSLVKLFPDAELMNLGGGFKVARMPNEPHVELADISAHLYQLLTDFDRETGRKIHLELEPGAFLTANCGWLLSEVIDITDTGSEGHTFIRLNTGMNDFLRPTLYGAQHPIYVVHEDSENKPRDAKEYVVIGHNCESGDLLTPMYGDPETLGPRELPACYIGDYCVIGGAGAYCAAMCARGYNSYIQAKETFID